jgi:energy-coupling factor transporter ATP-binding protein EcfA2
MMKILNLLRIFIGLLSGVWNSLPIFFKLAIGAAAALILFKVLGYIEGFFIGFRWPFLILAVFLWLFVIAGILYSRGLFRSGPGWLIQFLSQLTGESGSSDRSAYLWEAVEAIKGLAGLHEVKRELDLILTAAEDARKHNLEALGTQAPGIMLILYGEHGCGKTTLSQYLAPLFYGLSLVDHPEPIHISTSYDIEKIEPGHLIMFDDADWLTENENLSTARDIGRILMGKIAQFPNEIVVVMALSTAGLQRLENTPEHQSWLNRFDTRRLYFEEPDDEKIKQIFSNQLNSLHIPADQSAIEISHRILENERKTLGKDFDYGHRPRKLAERIKRIYHEKQSLGSQDDKEIILSSNDLEFILYE